MMTILNSTYQLKFTFCLLLLISYLNTSAQDAQLSQYYAAPMYLNPAIVGSSGDGRATMNYRNQWVGIPSNYITFIAGFDTPLPKNNISIGGQIQQDIMAQNGGSLVNRTSFNATGGYKIKINKKYTVSFGLQVGFEQSSLDFDQLIFGDQISDDGITNGATKEKVDQESNVYPDISSGVLVYGKNVWLGLSFYHMNQPITSKYSNGDNYLPLRFSMQAGYRIPLTYKWHGSVPDYSDKYVSVMCHYESQGKQDQLSTGAILNVKPILFGVWYRGLILKESEDPTIYNHDALVVMSGVEYKNMVFGYSFDLPIGGLSIDEGMSHEVSLKYNFNFYPDYRKRKRKSKQGLLTDKCPIPNL